MLTIKEMKEIIIQQVPEVDFLELLNINTSMLVNAFEEELIEKLDEIIKGLEIPEEIEDGNE
jgi:hypothetical protein